MSDFRKKTSGTTYTFEIDGHEYSVDECGNLNLPWRHLSRDGWVKLSRILAKIAIDIQDDEVNQ